MKRLTSLFLAALLCVTMLVPQTVLAEEAPAEGEPAVLAEETPAAQEQTVSADPYFQQTFPDLEKGGNLIFPESMAEVKRSEPKYGSGLLLKGKISDLMSGKIELKEELDFDRNPVGRISFDGLSDRDAIVTVHVFLDGEEEPAASFRLGSQMGKKEWVNAGDHTADVYAKRITGKHKVSVQLEITGKEASKKTRVLLRSLEFSESSLPVFYFHIDESRGSIAAMNGSNNHSVECYGSVDIQVPDGYVSEYTGKEVKSVNGLELEYIRGRGNSTWAETKKPYKVKLSKKQDLFGMGANKHWILLANRYDNSFVRNRMTYWLGARLGLEYTPQCLPVDVVMNGQYYGSYLLCEQIRVGESRVEIDDLEESDESIRRTDEPFITGGYLFSLFPDSTDNPDNMFTTRRDVSMLIESPEFTEYNNETMQAYIRKYIQAAEDAIFGENFKDKDGKPYTDYLDLAAAADYWWVQEFSANGDAFISGSTYLYKKRDGKLFWGPLWDFDYVAWGDLEYDSEAPDGLYCTNMVWFDQMKNDPEFIKLVMQRWDVLKGLLEEVTKEGGLLDQYYEQTRISAAYDREKWGPYGEGWFGYGEFYPFPNELEEEPEWIPEQRSYSDEINQLRRWIDERKSKVDACVADLSPAVYTLKFKADGKVIKKIKAYKNMPVTSLPKAPKKKGYTFRGWYAKNVGYFSAGDYAYRNMTLTAKYVKNAKVVKAQDLFFSEYQLYAPLYSWEGEMEFYPLYTVVPYNATENRVKWTSSKPEVASVNELGGVTCHKKGTAKITGTLSTGKKSSFTLHIFDPEETEENYPEYLKMKPDTMKIYKGDYKQIKTVFGPKPCTHGYLRWISLDESICSVDDIGIVTAKKPGTTSVLAFDQETGLYAYCKIRVLKKK